MFGDRWFCLVLLALAVGLPMNVMPARAAEPVLADTQPLTLRKPLDEVMVDGLRRFCRRELSASRAAREQHWRLDFAGVPAYTAAVAPNRERFRALIGAVDPRLTSDPTAAAQFELQTALDRSSIVARGGGVTVHAVRWPVLEGVSAEGLLLVPRTVRAGVVALPDADWTPERFCGLADGPPRLLPFAGKLAAAGCLVVVPALISRSDELSGHPKVGFTNQPHREYVYRQAFELGRHIIGYEVQTALAAVDLLRRHRGSELPVGVAGVGEGGLLAFYAAALDPRITSTLVSGYFHEREGIWQEPIYRNVWGLLTEFGDAELARLIAPRRLVIEASGGIEVPGPPAARPGRKAAAAPGRILVPPLPSVREEFERAGAIYRRLGREAECRLVASGEDGQGPAGTSETLQRFAEALGVRPRAAARAWKIEALPDSSAREKRRLGELCGHVQELLRRSGAVRDAIWQPAAASTDECERQRGRLRAWVHDELIGRLEKPRVDPNPRTRQVIELPEYTGYEVLLNVVDEITASGILLLPRNLKPGERRPVVVCQHGLEGTARDTFSRDPEPFRYYHAFAEELVKRGFVVYAPQNPYRGGDRFRLLQRMANPLKRSFFTFIAAQHAQTLDWLATLPFVDPDRIAFYGLSYGGKTALRVPPLVERYCLAICSGDFTDWVKSLVTLDEPYGYLGTIEYEVPEWNMGHIANHAELAMLMAPRAFMVEAGHRDGGQPTELVAGEFGKVRRHYDRLGIGERAELEFFDGPHTIHGQGTFAFLHRHLAWPAPQPAARMPASAGQ